MKRRDTILALLALGAASGAPAALAQPAKPPRRIATIDDGHETSRARGWLAFRKRLQELGYVEGAGFVIEARFAKVQAAQLPALAAELTALKPDVIVAAGTPASLAAMRATAIIPIVSLGAGDPIKTGLVGNLARPKGNLTGITNISLEVANKWLELLREIAPHAKSIALLAYADNQASMQLFRELRQRAKPLGISITLLDGSSRSNVERAFKTIAHERIAALIVSAAGVLLDHRQQIVEAAAGLRIPAVYANRDYAAAGGLMSYGTDYDALFPRAADYVHRILQGAKPSDLPFERASVFRLVVNATALNALGLKIPESVRVRVDEVIQ